jgi:type IX secretion system PorP/SprF family membrane protein
MLRITLLSLALVILAGKASAQQVPLFSHYSLNYLQINPAVAGSKECLDMKLGYRRQWMGIPEGPRTGFGNIHGHIGNKSGNFHGIGATVYSDDMGPLGSTGLNAVYAYHMKLNRIYRLSAGIGVGFMQYRFDVGGVVLPDVQLINDPAFDNRASSQFLFPNIQFGLWLYRDDRFYGFAVHNVAGNNINILGLDSRLNRHYSLAAGRAISMQDGFTFKPSAHVQLVQGSRMSFEATGMFDYRDVFDFGVGFRSESGIIGLVRVDLFKYITLAYAYDFALSRIRYDGRHTHEVVLGFQACARGESGRTVPCAAYD